ncbi:MAG: hypothetical protein RH942_03910 [Kiloniellaceae bacterium]
MIIVIQCAAGKKAEAGHLYREDGRLVLFVADPSLAPPSDRYDYARPDDASDTGETWRQRLQGYNKTPGENPSGLLPAWQLYENRAYAKLVECFGRARLFILSAGWGLLAADFLTPAYDITFSASAEKYKRRRKEVQYDDFRMLPADTTEQVVFLGGKDYIDLFCRLTDGLSAERLVFYNSASPPDAPRCVLRRFETKTRTNWHYECAQALMAGDLAA